MTELSRLLQAADRRNPMTVRARAKRVDGSLHFATLARYQSGDHPAHPDEGTLRILAQAYDLPYAQVQEAAGVPVGVGPYNPPPEAARLTRREQEAITTLIKAIVAGKAGDGPTISYGVDESPDSVADESQPSLKPETELYPPESTTGKAIHRTRSVRGAKRQSNQ